MEETGLTSKLVIIPGAPHGLFTGEGGQTAAQELLGWMQQHLLN